jgi:hypothetical protein
VNWIQLAHDKDHRLGFLREEQSWEYLRTYHWGKCVILKRIKYEGSE